MSDNAIAVIGYSISVAGADDADKFYEMISQNKTGLRKSTPDDQREYCPQEVMEDDNFINIGGGPKDYQAFDEQFFGYSPKEASLLDPQIRKALEHAYLTVEHAGYSPKSLKSVCSCYIANSVNAYFNDNLKPLHDQSSDAEKNQMVFLNESDFLSTRIAYHFNWRGGAYTVKCGCSSSMVAIHEACKSLLQYDSDVALAGGVNIKSRYQYGYLYEEGSILSANGRCCPFSDDASGTVFANGLGFVLLKRLDDAIEDGNTIHAVILSSAINNDGNDKVGYMAPSMNGQKAAMQAALAFADLTPNQVSYIEAHGTGTTIGDPIEFNGLMEVYGDCAEQSIALRAVKANIGHLDAASGVVSLIKVIEDLKHQTISPMHHFKTLNSRCDNRTNPFDFDTELKPWNSVDGKRIAAVSSFGIGGTNGQLMVEDYQNDDKPSNSESPIVIALSAKTTDSLMNKISKLDTWLTHQDQCDLSNLSNTLLFGREHFNYRAAWLVQTKEALHSALQQFTENQIIHCKDIGEHPTTQTLLSEPSSLLENYLKGTSWVYEENLIKFKRLPAPGYAFEKHVHWIKPFAFKNQKKLDISQWFYMPNWQRQEAPLNHKAIQTKTILFFNDESTFAVEYLKRLRDLGCDIIEVLPGTQFIKNSNRKFVVSPERKSDYLNLFETLKILELAPNAMVHCWSLGQGNDDFNSAMQLGLYSVLFCTQGMLESQFTLPQCMQIITNGIANVSGIEPLTPFNATLIGVSQVLPKEMDNIHCQLLDIGVHTNDAFVSQQCLFELMRGNNIELALRGRYRFAKAYQPVSLDNDALDKFIIKEEKNYLVIGGLGNFGMELSEFIGAQHGGRVFLSTRMQFPQRNTWPNWLNNQPDNSITDKIRQIQAIEQLGAEVHIVRADVCDKASLTALKAYIEDNFGPLSGVVHAAGIVDSGMIAQKTTRSLEQVFAAKVHGTQLVCDVFLTQALDFLILCSSMNSIIGGLGQLDNTAANAYIDAYADYCQGLGYSQVLAINWGAVNEARARNYSAQPQFAKLSEEHIKNKMGKHEIFDVYHRLFSCHLGPRVVVSTIDFNQVIDNWSRVGSLKSLLKVSVNQKKQRNLSRDAQLPVSSIEKTIASLWQDLLGVDVVVQEDDFFSLGGNSLVAIQFISKLTQKYPIKMHAMSIYEYPTLVQFAQYTKQLINEVQAKQTLMNEP